MDREKQLGTLVCTFVEFVWVTNWKERHLPSIFAVAMAEDTMENEWGVNFITHTERRCGRRTFNGFDIDISLVVPGFKLHSVNMSGTDANGEAIALATDCHYKRCLFGVGCYVGGDKPHQMYSTSGYTPRQVLAMPQCYEEANAQCKEQTVPLPYHIESDWMTADKLLAYEKKCLLHLHETLLFALFIGRPYKALVLEYILGGNGAELSHRFLRELGLLLIRFDVVVIADEVLTGGRVGPGIAMTTSMPKEYVDCVEFITLGKFMGCGVVMRKRGNKPVDVDVALRGFSTQAECGLPSKILNDVLIRLGTGLLEDRKQLVLKTMKCSSPDAFEHWWGRGLLLFSTYKRPQTTKGLKCRLLPRLELSKLVKLDSLKTGLTRSSVCKEIVGVVEGWIRCQREQRSMGENAFTDALVAYLLCQEPTNDMVVFRPEDVLDYIGEGLAEKMAKQYWLRELNKHGRRVTPSPTSLVKRAIMSATTNTRDSRIIYKKRVGNKRTEVNMVDKKVLFPANY